MKKINNLYNEIIDIKKIQFMYNRKGKINTKNKGKLENPKVIVFIIWSI